MPDPCSSPCLRKPRRKCRMPECDDLSLEWCWVLPSLCFWRFKGSLLMKSMDLPEFESAPLLINCDLSAPATSHLWNRNHNPTYIIGFGWKVRSSCSKVFKQCLALSEDYKKNIGHYYQGHLGFLFLGPDLYLPIAPAFGKNPCIVCMRCLPWLEEKLVCIYLACEDATKPESLPF